MGIDDGEGLDFGIDAEQVRKLKLGDPVLYQKIENEIVSRGIAEVVMVADDGEKCLITIRPNDVIEGEENLEIEKAFWADKSELRLFE